MQIQAWHLISLGFVALIVHHRRPRTQARIALHAAEHRRRGQEADLQAQLSMIR